MVKDRLDYEEKLRKPIRPMLCICSDSPPEQFGENANVINIEKDLNLITERIMNFVKEGKASIENCIPVSLMPKLKYKITIRPSTIDICRDILLT